MTTALLLLPLLGAVLVWVAPVPRGVLAPFAFLVALTEVALWITALGRFDFGAAGRPGGCPRARARRTRADPSRGAGAGAPRARAPARCPPSRRRARAASCRPHGCSSSRARDRTPTRRFPLRRARSGAPPRVRSARPWP